MFDDLPELYNIKIVEPTYSLIKYYNSTLYLSKYVLNNIDEDDKLILWMILRNKNDLNITNPIENYKAAHNEWILYNKNYEKFLIKLSDLIKKFSKSEYLKDKHLKYIDLLKK
jgi:hypothetical protein